MSWQARIGAAVLADFMCLAQGGYCAAARGVVGMRQLRHHNGANALAVCIVTHETGQTGNDEQTATTLARLLRLITALIAEVWTGWRL
jgi:hypothetical protein